MNKELSTPYELPDDVLAKIVYRLPIGKCLRLRLVSVQFSHVIKFDVRISRIRRLLSSKDYSRHTFDPYLKSFVMSATTHELDYIYRRFVLGTKCKLLNDIWTSMFAHCIAYVLIMDRDYILDGLDPKFFSFKDCMANTVIDFYREYPTAKYDQVFSFQRKIGRFLPSLHRILYDNLPYDSCRTIGIILSGNYRKLNFDPLLKETHYREYGLVLHHSNALEVVDKILPLNLSQQHYHRYCFFELIFGACLRGSFQVLRVLMKQFFNSPSDLASVIDRTEYIAYHRFIPAVKEYQSTVEERFNLWLNLIFEYHKEIAFVILCEIVRLTLSGDKNNFTPILVDFLEYRLQNKQNPIKIWKVLDDGTTLLDYYSCAQHVANSEPESEVSD